MTPDPQDQDDDQAQPFIAHLIELRERLLACIISVVVVFLGLSYFSADIYGLLAKPLLKSLPSGSSMIATDVASPFLTPFKLTFVVSIFVCMPYILYQVWAFVAPGLYKHERQLVFPLLASSSFLFYTGAAFAYFAVFPVMFAFFSAATPTGVTMMTDISRYLDFVLTTFLAFGLAFEVPLLTIMLVLVGIVTREQLVAARPYIIVGVFVIGAILTPPDIVSQCLLAVPMWLLFELGLLFSRMLSKRQQSFAQKTAEEHDEY
jgi:sec-independent protein translocase protein TatC